MTEPKRNLQRRESTVKEFRILTNQNTNKKLGYDLRGIDAQTNELNKIYDSNELEMKKKLAAALEVKKMEATGMFSADAIRQQKIKLGILTEESTTGSGNTNVIDNLMMQLASEQDPVARASMMNSIVVLDMMNKPGNQNNPQMIMMMQNMNKQALPPKSTFEEEMTKLMMKKFTEEPKSELDNLGKLSSLFEGVQKMMPQSNPLQEMKDNLKLFQEMGIAVTPGNTIEERRIQLE